MNFQYKKSILSDDNEQSIINGFTLVEVLVALVVSSLLIIILLDGLITAEMAANRSDTKNRAISITFEKINILKNQAGVAADLTGETDGLNWQLKEREIATDPRGIYTLVEAEMTVSSKTAPKLFIRKKRYLKRLINR